MAFDATKKEWSELYCFFRLLVDGKVYMGNKKAERSGEVRSIAFIEREEHDGPRRYYIKDEEIEIVGEAYEKSIPRVRFDEVSQLILTAIKSTEGYDVDSPDGVEEFLDEINLFDLEAKTTDRTDFSVAFFDNNAPLHGFSVYSRLSVMSPLLDGGRTANLKMEQTGVKFATPTVNKINALPESPNEVAERMMMIERLGGQLKFSDVADRVFRANLFMIDSRFARLLAEMVRLVHLDGMTRVHELVKVMNEVNPLKVKSELITKHHYYEYKMKQFLIKLALGMRPAKIFRGQDSAIEGMMLINGKGDVLCYHKSDVVTFEDFLFYNTRFEKSDVEKDKYGFLEKENGVYYFKLNVKIGLLKR